MIIIRIMGGLGNQMFQYAFFLKHRKMGHETYIDLNWYKYCNDHNGYELDRVFNIDINGSIATKDDIKHLGYDKYNKFSRLGQRLFGKNSFYEQYGENAIIFDEDALADRDRYYAGYWQSEKYFIDIKEDLRNSYKFQHIDDYKTQMYCSEAMGSQSVSVHIRRGDYINNKMFKDICDLQYYKKAVELILGKVSNPVFFVFSNDIKWCIENISFKNCKVNYISYEKKCDAYKEMFLMTRCKHHILANSTFSWWGKWLDDDKGVTIAPKKWINGLEDLSKDIILDDWLKV